MAPKSLSLLIAICSILLASASMEASATVGGWQPIANLTDPKVVEIAEFAVKEHNKQVKSTLGLVSVVKGETQVVSGMNYRLAILTKDNLLATATPASKYLVVVWDKPWKKERRVTSFLKIA